MIYMDNAATTAPLPRVLETMVQFYKTNYANPSSVYSLGARAKNCLEDIRENIGDFLGAKSGEIYFTSGGSEANNWALISLAESRRALGRHIVTSTIEHPSVSLACDYLKRQGFEITRLPVDGDGLVSPAVCEKALRFDTILLSIMFANNEIGTIQPIKELGALARERGIPFHTDAVQAVGHLPIHVEEFPIDLLSASGHKFYGPKGTGFLYIKEGIQIGSFLHGGAQERGRRAGTVALPEIAGMGAAIDHAREHMEEEAHKQRILRDEMISLILQKIPGSRLNGSPLHRLPGNVHFCFPGISGEMLLILLDQEGICA